MALHSYVHKITESILKQKLQKEALLVPVLEAIQQHEGFEHCLLQCLEATFKGEERGGGMEKVDSIVEVASFVDVINLLQPAFPCPDTLKRQAEECTCSICHCFAVEATTACYQEHIFCCTCLEDWLVLKEEPDCPSCTQHIQW